MRIAVSSGDPAGIGPEIILGALQQPLHSADVTVFGARPVFEMLSEQLNLPITFDIVDVSDGLDCGTLRAGKASAIGALVQRSAFLGALDAVDSKSHDAVVTAPWTKSLMPLIGAAPVGHTEILAERYNAPEHVMMLAGSRLRVSLVTTHLPLMRVGEALSIAKIQRVSQTTIKDLKRWFGVVSPRIAILGLNPHAGEQGHMGDEEIRIIGPAIQLLQEEFAGEAVIEGPFPADTLFARFASEAPFDAVVCMYHDQGLIALKALHFGEAINITLGLPILRTSVDHGSAYDIAWQGKARWDSMRYAITSALESLSRST